MTKDREQELREMLVALQRSYYEAARPIVNELVDLEARKPPRPVIIMMPDPPPTYIREMIAEGERLVRKLTGIDEISPKIEPEK